MQNKIKQYIRMSLDKIVCRNPINLDLSSHNLNNSSSKQQYSFPKSSRFIYGKSMCDSFYDLPSSKTHRTTSFGYGNKDIGLRTQHNTPQPATYNIESEFNKNTKGTSFGAGREEMSIGGPLRESVTKSYIPGPGNYKNESTLKATPISLKSRLPERSQDSLGKVPGPGTYKHDELGSQRYYATSKHLNHTNSTKIRSTSGHGPLNPHKTSDLGPGQYPTTQTDIQFDGRYVLSNSKNSKCRMFSRLPRQDIMWKNQPANPGPGSYTPFTYFGPA